VDELTAAGVHLTRHGAALRYQTRPGVTIAPYRERIAAHKPDLLTLLHLQEEIVAAATTALASFDRAAYDELWRRWQALQEEMS
jgi:hypothetical protein